MSGPPHATPGPARAARAPARPGARAGPPRSAALDLPREGERAAADDGELPARLDPHRDVDSPVAGSLRPALVAHLGERLAHDGGDPLPVRERRARLRVDVDPQLVGTVDVGAPRGPGVEVDHREVR